MQQKVTGWAFLALICSSTILHTLAYPQHAPLISQATSNVRTQNTQYYSNTLPLPNREQIAQERRLAEKPNALKKVALDDLDDIQNNSISDGSGSSWSNMLGMIMQMIFNPASAVGPSKSDGLDSDSPAPSPWTFLFSMGLKILTAILGGTTNNVGIDKVDNESSPMQSILAAVLSTVLGAKDPDQVASMAKQAGEFINIVVNLLDALKTSFSHRSLAARSMGRKDSISDAAIAGIAMLKTYVRSFKTNDDKCLQKYVCDANNECSADIGPKSVFCQLGTYAASFVLERQSSGTFDQFYEAGRRGRSGVDCRHLYLECNEETDMTMENLQSQIGIPSMQLAERYAEYSGPAHEPAIYYPYEPSPPAQGPMIATKHHFGGSHNKNNAAMSALTLLAFLFFLHILQQCLKDHMTAMSTPQVMIMTSGKEGEENIAKLSRNKIDKTGEINTDRENKRNVHTTETSSSENYLMKIVTSDTAPWRKTRNNQNDLKKFDTQSPASSNFFTPADDG